VVIHAPLQPKIEVLFQIEEIRWKEKKSRKRIGSPKPTPLRI
jgi:hypothetical protein